MKVVLDETLHKVVSCLSLYLKGENYMRLKSLFVLTGFVSAFVGGYAVANRRLDISDPVVEVRNDTDDNPNPKPTYTFDSRMSAEEALGVIKELIDEYGYATLADLKDTCGWDRKFADHMLRWVNVDDAKIKTTHLSGREGTKYALVMPYFI